MADLQGQSLLRIPLTPFATTLAEVVVRDKIYTVHSLVEDVVAAYEKNYGVRPYELQGFYREVRKVNDVYGYLMEVACRIYKKDYKTPYVAIEKVRSNARSKHFDTGTDENFLETILVNDYVSNPVMGFYKRYSKKDNYVMADTTVLDDQLVYVVSKGSLPYEKETLYIHAKDLAIIRYDVEDNYGPDGNNQPKRRIGKNLLARYRHLNMTNRFVKVNERYYPSYIRTQFEYGEYNEAKKVTERRFVMTRELSVNQVTTQNIAMTSAEEMKSIALDDQLQQYDEVFWRDYNILTLTPLEEKIISDLEKSGALENQFRKKTGPVKNKK